MGKWFPMPQVVTQSEAAIELLIETRLEADEEYAKAEAKSDAVGTTVWGRVSEHVRKLALLHAVSERHDQPEIGSVAVEWARELVMHQTRRMLFMAQQHVAETPFQADCLKVLRKLREAPDQRLPHSVLLKRMKLKSKEFGDLIETLEQRGDIQTVTAARQGWAQRAYRLTGVNHG